MKNVTIYICLAAFLSVGALFSVQATSLTLDENNNLQVTNEAGEEIASLPSGSISEKITADNQAFKISFGEDLSGKNTIIIYPDPEAPQSLSFNLMDQPVSMTADSVLTVTASQDGTLAQFQAGVLGEISVADSPISPGSSINIRNGQMLAASETTPLFDDPSTEQDMTVEEVPSAPRTTTQEADRLISEFDQGLIVKEVNGTVMMAPKGTDVMDLLRNSTTLPKLKVGDVIPEGASIRTDFGGTIYVAQSPGVTFQILENTELKVEKNSYTRVNGVEKRTFEASMNKGGIINNLDGLDPGHTDYKIQTPLAVAAARGTAFSVFTSNSISVIITAKGEVEVITRGGTYSTTEGQKTVVTFNDGIGEERVAEFEATSEELQVIQNLIQAARNLNASRRTSGGRPVTDDRGLTKTDGSGGGADSDDQIFLDRADQDQVILTNAVNDFIGTFQPTLNPGAITPIESGQ